MSRTIACCLICKSSIDCSKITIDEFCDQARRCVLEDPYLCLLHYELNTRLVEYLKLNVHADDWSRITYSDLEQLIDTICDELIVLQKGNENDLARQFDTWPLTSPALGAQLEQTYRYLN